MPNSTLPRAHIFPGSFDECESFAKYHMSSRFPASLKSLHESMPKTLPAINEVLANLDFPGRRKSTLSRLALHPSTQDHCVIDTMENALKPEVMNSSTTFNGLDGIVAPSYSAVLAGDKSTFASIFSETTDMNLHPYCHTHYGATDLPQKGPFWISSFASSARSHESEKSGQMETILNTLTCLQSRLTTYFPPLFPKHLQMDLQQWSPPTVSATQAPPCWSDFDYKAHQICANRFSSRSHLKRAHEDLDASACADWLSSSETHRGIDQPCRAPDSATRLQRSRATSDTAVSAGPLAPLRSL